MHETDVPVMQVTRLGRCYLSGTLMTWRGKQHGIRILGKAGGHNYIHYNLAFNLTDNFLQHLENSTFTYDT
jgi:hypothetical protein